MILEIIDFNMKKQRWYVCRNCGEQFSYRRLLEVHKKLAFKKPFICSKEGK